jgi:hypothetical protein
MIRGFADILNFLQDMFVKDNKRNNLPGKNHL